jgi:hypothetical protein
MLYLETVIFQVHSAVVHLYTVPTKLAYTMQLTVHAALIRCICYKGEFAFGSCVVIVLVQYSCVTRSTGEQTGIVETVCLGTVLSMLSFCNK